jgi:two-component system, NtrC family, sensor histidine kinase KinB
VLILVVIGCEGITLITQQGQSIDVMLRENYRFVIACEEMKGAMGRMDRGKRRGDARNFVSSNMYEISI